MYVSTFMTLQTALSGVEAAQEELATTGENISNANTTGYEQQSVDLVETSPLRIASGGGGYELGTGVNARSVDNASDPYIDAAWRQVNAGANAAGTTRSYLEQIQALVGEPSSSGISAQLQSFWSDWNELADNPTSTAAKQAVIDVGSQLAQSLHLLGSELDGSSSTSILSQADAQYSNLLAGPAGSGASGGRLYNDAYQIASLNRSIVQSQAAGENPNTLIDQRNSALDDLSGLGNVSVTDNSDGSVSVYFGGLSSVALVSDPVGSGAPVDSPDPGNNFTGSWISAWNGQFASADAAAAAAAGASGEPQSASALAGSVGGTLGALIGLAGFSSTGLASAGNAATSAGAVGTVSASLDGVTAALVSEVNAPAAPGGPAGATVPLTTDFFTASGTTATTIAVNSVLLADPTQLQVNTSGAPGDNDIALAETANSGGAADTALGAFVEQVGDLVADAKDTDATQSALSTQVTDQRQSAEGVDLSQEMANLISEQQAYEASARVMNAFGTVIDALLSAVGG